MIKSSFRKISSIPIIKVSSLTAVSTFVRIGTNFILSKILAVTIGPTGIALVGQIINGSNIFMNIATGGLSQGITKYIAENDDYKEQRKIINTAYTFVLILSSLVAIILIVFSKQWSSLFFHTNIYRDVIVYMGAFVFLFAYNNTVLAVINGLKQFKLFVAINIANNIAGLLLTLILLYTTGLRGALIATVLYQSAVSVITLFFIRKQRELLSFNKLSLPTDLVKKLVGFSLMTFVSVICVSYSQIAIRSYITIHISLKAAGIWEALNRLSSGYLMFASASMATYYLPRLSELKTEKNVWNEIIYSSKAILPFVLLASLMVFVFRKFIIIILFDSAFLNMQELIFWQVIGDFFKMAAWMFAYLMWAKRWVATFIISEILLALVYYLITVVLIAKTNMGIAASSLGYCITYICYFITMFFLIKTKLKISFKKR